MGWTGGGKRNSHLSSVSSAPALLHVCPTGGLAQSSHCVGINIITRIFWKVFLFLIAKPCGWQDLSSPTGDWTCVLSSESSSPNHWTAREVAEVFWVVLKVYFLTEVQLTWFFKYTVTLFQLYIHTHTHTHTHTYTHTHTHTYIYMRACKLSHFSCVRFFATLWTVAHQAPLSMGFSRQEYWWGISPLLQGIFPTSNPGLLHRRQMR